MMIRCDDFVVPDRPCRRNATSGGWKLERRIASRSGDADPSDWYINLDADDLCFMFHVSHDHDFFLA